MYTSRAMVVVAFVTGVAFGALGFVGQESPQAKEPTKRVYQNRLKRIENPKPLLADHPEFVQPVQDLVRYEAPPLINDPDGDLEVRAWRFSYNARGIVEVPNRIRSQETAVIMVHPWGIDDGQGWKTPEPNGVADFCTVEKNHLAAEHTKTIIDPFLKALRPRVATICYSLPGAEDPIRKKIYRSVRGRPTEEQRLEGQEELEQKLGEFVYQGDPLLSEFLVDDKFPMADYFKQFPGIDASAKYNNKGFWDLPIPVTRDVTYFPDDVVIYDSEGYELLKEYLKKSGVRHVLLTGYATDMCFCRTTAGYENLSKDFNVFLVGDATLATFPAMDTPRYATNAHIAYASLQQFVTQVSWVKFLEE